MSFQTYFLLSSYAFATSGFMALALTGRLDSVAIALYVAALIGSWRLETRNSSRLIELKVARRLALGYLPFFAFDAVFLSPPFLVLTHFVLFMSAVKLFQRKADSDWVWIYALTFFEITLAASLTINITFMLSLIVFLFTFVTTLAAFEIRRSHRNPSLVEEEEHAMRRERPHPLARVRNLVSIAGAQVVLVTLVAMPIFLFMPRFSGGALGGGFAEAQGITGFSDTVELGDVARIQQSSRVVMHVQLTREPGRWLRWRGVALDTFDGTKWSATAIERRSIAVEVSRSDRYVVDVPASREPDLLGQTIILEGIDSNVLFAARRVFAVEGAFSSLFTDRIAGNLRGPVHPGTRFSYTAFSDLSVPSSLELAAEAQPAEFDEQISRLYLQPPDMVDPRVRELAHEVAGGEAAPYEKARRIEGFLKENFSYTLQPPRSDPMLDPVSDFCLNTRAGHCELFASAMVLMLRAEGVPARLVNGFQMGEYNDISQTYRVRERDAHSWVEVWFQGKQAWVEFDPTPPGGINTYSASDTAAQFRQALEALQIYWIRYVVGLDDREQVSILKSVHRRFLAARAWFERNATAWKQWARERVADASRSGALERDRIVAGMAMLMLAGTLAFALFVLHSRGWSLGGFVIPVWRWRAALRRGKTPPERQAVLFYGQMLAMLAQHGYERGPSETPREFADRCGIDEVKLITERYHEARWGRFERDGASQVSAALAALGVSLRSRRRDRKT